jgi:hypothetical protein
MSHDLSEGRSPVVKVQMRLKPMADISRRWRPSCQHNEASRSNHGARKLEQKLSGGSIRPLDDRYVVRLVAARTRTRTTHTPGQ